jgi:hypothetical protein
VKIIIDTYTWIEIFIGSKTGKGRSSKSEEIILP